MGKKLYESYHISPEKTEKLALTELCVLAQEEHEFQYRAVTQQYFSKDKAVCPTCGGTKTRVSKIVTRKLKDILISDDGQRQVIDLVFDQRYHRCCDCKNRVFPEDVSFAEPGCRYSNRLSDLLAEGTLTNSYSKVCAHYGVPASKTSVGVIMRRIFRQRLGKLPPLKTPITLSIFMVSYINLFAAIVVAIFIAWKKELVYRDVKQGSNEIKFVKPWVLPPVLYIHNRAWRKVYQLGKIFLCPPFCFPSFFYRYT